MNWQIIQKDFSLFQTDEWKEVYSKKAQENQVIVLSYVKSDLASICLLPKQGYIINDLSFLIPEVGCIEDNIQNYAHDFIYSFTRSPAVTMMKKELAEFNLVESQVLGNVLLKFYQEQTNPDRYQELAFDTNFFFIRKDKIPFLIDYFNYISNSNASLVVEDIGVDLNEFVDAINASCVKEVYGETVYNFYLAVEAIFKTDQIKLENQLQFINEHIDELVEQAKCINSIYKNMTFYTSYYQFNLITEFEIGIVKLQLAIDVYRTKLLTHLDDESFFYAAFTFLKFLNEQEHKFIEYKTEINQMKQYLSQYMANFHQRYPDFFVVQKYIEAIYHRREDDGRILRV